jgi:hypothetical protein
MQQFHLTFTIGPKVVCHSLYNQHQVATTLQQAYPKYAEDIMVALRDLLSDKFKSTHAPANPLEAYIERPAGNHYTVRLYPYGNKLYFDPAPEGRETVSIQVLSGDSLIHFMGDPRHDIDWQLDRAKCFKIEPQVKEDDQTFRAARPDETPHFYAIQAVLTSGKIQWVADTQSEELAQELLTMIIKIKAIV